MNLPNKLTLLRVALVPVFMVFAALADLGADVHDQGMALAAAVVFAAASLTDYFDGHLARKHGWVTSFGKFMDPLADKMLTTAAFVYMVVDRACSPVVLAVVLFREFAVAGVRMLAAEQGTVIAANKWGKVKTVLQMATILVYYFGAACTNSLAFAPVLVVTMALCWAVAAVTVLSGGIYLWQNRACFLNTK